MPAVIVFPIHASEGSQACLNGSWRSGRWEVFEAINNSLALIKEELAPGFQFIFSKNNREHTIQKDIPECQGFSAFELIQPPKSLSWLPAMMVLHLENDSLFSATALDEIARLRKSGRGHLEKIGIQVGRIPETARAIVFTNDLHLLENQSSNIFVERVDVFTVRSWVTESCIIAGIQEVAANVVVNEIDMEKISWKARRNFVNKFESVLIHIWWEHVLSKEVSRSIFEVLRSRNGIVGRYAQLSELAEMFSESLRLREQKFTNMYLVALGIVAIVVPILVNL
jgi:hypothetical protein